jgi:hypothetical protein
MFLICRRVWLFRRGVYALPAIDRSDKFRQRPKIDFARAEA